MKRIVTLVFILLIVGLGTLLSVINFEPISVDYVLGKVQVPLALLVITSFALGIIIGVLLNSCLIIKQRRSIKALEKRIKHSQTEVHSLRKAPLKNYAGDRV